MAPSGTLLKRNSGFFVDRVQKWPNIPGVPDQVGSDLPIWKTKWQAKTHRDNTGNMAAILKFDFWELMKIMVFDLEQM